MEGLIHSHSYTWSRAAAELQKSQAPVNPGQQWGAGLPVLLRGHTRDRAVEQRGSSRWLREAVGSASYQMQRGPFAPRFPHPQIMCGKLPCTPKRHKTGLFSSKIIACTPD